MTRFLILLAVIPIVVAFVARWWFGMRIISRSKKQEARCDLDKWEDTFGPETLPTNSRDSVNVLAEHLRKSALLDWKTREPKAAASREGARKFGMAVPPLALMIGILGMLVGRIPAIYLLPIFLLAIASAVIISYLSISPELKAILITSRRLRDTRIFARRDDEDAVIRTATALAWKEAAPPVFNLLQR